MHYRQNFVEIEPHAQDAYLYEERLLRLTNLKKALRGEYLDFHHHVGGGGSLFS